MLETKQSQTPVRTRFAPSPTGHLHLGGARTALFNWLLARNQGGEFLLRIEDTDQTRSTQEAAQAIISSLKWLGIHWDEAIYFQSERISLYQAAIQQLLNTRHAYRCYCSKERLATLREVQLHNKKKPRYDRHCRNLQAAQYDKPYVVRFANPMEGDVQFHDLVRGDINIRNEELDDLIIARYDHTPTYNLTAVVDDHDMTISHVIRGDDHLNNTPKQINISKALGFSVPYYAHIPMILGEDGRRLSKREGAVGVLHYREEGFLPDALLNYLLRLGFSYKNQEIFSSEEMIKLFSIKAINQSSAALNYKKLIWLNQHYLKTTDPSRLKEAFDAQLKTLKLDSQHKPQLEAVIALQAERSKTLKDMAERSQFFYQEACYYDTALLAQHITQDLVQPLTDVRELFSKLVNWDQEAIHDIIKKTATYYELKFGQLAQAIRVTVTGGTVSPPIDATLQVLGKQVTLERLEQVLSKGLLENHGS